MTLVTARIPELTQNTAPLSDNDKMPLWLNSDNKTRHINLSLLRSFIITGGGTTITPVQSGGVVIVKVPDTPGGTDTLAVPSLSGKSFNLEINGVPYVAQQDPAIAEAEFETLAGGGFKLLNGMLLFGGEKCKFELFESIGSPVTPGTGGSFVTGKKVVNTNYTLDIANDLKKIIQMRALATQITLTLPSVDDIADNTIIPIEASINNTKQNIITTTGGQYFYFNNISSNTLYISPGEVVWLYRDDDGFYVINDFGSNYKTLGDPYASYKVKPHTLLCKGQLLNRVDYPRLWEYVQTLGSSLVSEATWSTTEVTIDGRQVPFPYRGCYSTGDGTTTFRIPDLMNMFLRGVKTETGSDAERHLNKAGGYQDQSIQDHAHYGKRGDSYTGDAQEGFGVVGGGQNSNLQTDFLTKGVVKTDGGAAIGKSHTRPENIGVYWLINF